MFPLLSPAGIITSNTLVIAADDAVFVIDPGGTSGQGGELAAILADCAGARPVIVLLTHAHRDHFAALDEIDRPVTLVAHGAAAGPLLAGDLIWTQAQFNGGSYRRRAVDVRLFQDASIPLATPLVTATGETWARHQLPCGGNQLEILPAPGHSSCGLVFRLGHMLVVGDLPFAANPGLVGIAGWDQAGLITSAGNVRWLLTANPDLICLPGHGTLMPATAAFGRQLESMIAQARQFDRVAMMDATRLTGLRQYAAELLEETHRLSTLLAVRLDLVSYHLNSLEAHDQAGQVQAAVDTIAVDRALEDIACGYRDFYAGRHVEMEVLMRAAARLRRVAGLIAKGRHQPGVSVRLAGRVERLLTRFASAAVGLTAQDSTEPFDVAALVREVAGQVCDGEPPGDDLLAAADDEARFAAALASQMAARPPMSDLELTYAFDAALPPVAGDRQLLADALTTVIELLGSVSTGQQLHVTVRADGAQVTIAVEAQDIEAAQVIGPRTADLWTRLLAEQQATLCCAGTVVVIGVAAAQHGDSCWAVD